MTRSAQTVWHFIKEYIRYGDMSKIIPVIEKVLDDSNKLERERIAIWLEANYPYFPHIAKEVREL